MSDDARVWAGEGLPTKGTGEFWKVMGLLYILIAVVVTRKSTFTRMYRKVPRRE